MDTRVFEIMSRKPKKILFSASIQEAAFLMKEHDIGSLLVIDNNDELLGIITEYDLVRKAIILNLDSEKTLVKDLMTKDLITISPDSTINDAARVMKENDIRHLPVMDKNKLVGFLTMKDILRVQPEITELLLENSFIYEEEEFFKE